MDKVVANIFAYPYWNEVLKALKLTPIKTDFPNPGTNENPSTPKGGGEGEEHKALKFFIANNPTVVGLSATIGTGQTELPLASGDFLDVSFLRRGKNKSTWVAIEVKASTSSDGDISRGVFQCIKYKAVMEAELTAKGMLPNVRAILVLESKLPKKLVALKNILRVEVIEEIRVTAVPRK